MDLDFKYIQNVLIVLNAESFGHKEDIQTPHGPHTRDWYATYPYSSLCQGF